MPERTASITVAHAAEPWPRLLVFSEGSMSPNHGTGAIFLRNFASYPADRICNAFISTAEGACLPHSIDLNHARWPHTLGEHLAALPARIRNRVYPKRWHVLPASHSAIAHALEAAPFAPDLIYAVCWGAEGLVTLQAVLAVHPRTPLLLHFHDFWPSVSVDFRRLLAAIGPRITAAWAISEAIADYVRQASGKPCAIEPAFHIELPAVHKVAHRAADADFRAIIIGNFWQDALLTDVKALWRECQRRRASLSALQWYGPAAAVARLRANGRSPEPEVRPMEFLRGDALWQMLAAADLAIVPFSRERDPMTDYERYSIPSRLTELAAAGLPIFGLSGPDTPLARYLHTRDIGRCAPAGDSAAAAALDELIRDVALRESLGRRARALAEAEFGLRDYQRSLYVRLAHLASSRSA